MTNIEIAPNGQVGVDENHGENVKQVPHKNTAQQETDSSSCSDDENEKKHETDSVDSSDEALMEMLGLTSLDVHETQEEEGFTYADIKEDEKKICNLIHSQNLQEQYADNGFCFFPSELSVPAELMRRLTDELVWGGETVRSDKSYETIKFLKGGEIEERRTLTRLENFISYHDGWKELNDYVTKCISALLGRKMVLFKEKLNLKPPGGTGFAPHLDGPSLRVALGEEGPKHFVTVMVAIDGMTAQNGCLRIFPGKWSEGNTCEVVPPQEDGNPDAGGRAGAIPLEAAESMNFVNLTCEGGSIAAFSEWAPHRSSANTSPFSRRAVFLTYNPADEGDCHEMYYQKMEEKRNSWREKVGLMNRQQIEEDQQLELDALATVPK